MTTSVKLTNLRSSRSTLTAKMSSSLAENCLKPRESLKKPKEANPWDQIEQKYPPGTRVHGKIVNLLPYGAFIEIEPGIEGLIHVSEMSWVKNITDPSEVVKKGDDVEAIVLSVQKEEGKISLGLKQAEHNPWDDVEKKYPVNTNVKAEIKSLTNYGAFVELEPGVEGLIHI